MVRNCTATPSISLLQCGSRFAWLGLSTLALLPSVAAAQRAYLLSNPGQSAGWVYVSPTSTHIAYSAYDPDDNNFYLYTRRLDPAASPVKLQFPGATGLSGYSEDVGISPDGSRIAYRGIQPRGDDRPLAFFYSSPIDGGSTPVTLYTTPYAGGDTICEFPFAFTPNSSSIVYKATHGDINDYQLYTRPADGSTPAIQLSTNLGSNEYLANSFLVSRDGQRVVYSSWPQNSSSGNICSVPTDGSTPPIKLNVPPAAGSVIGGVPFITAERVVYIMAPGPSQPDVLYTSPIDGTAPPLQLAESSSNRFVNATISPDEKQALYVLQTPDGNHQDLFSRPLDASKPSVQLTPPTTGRGLYFNAFAVTPDSQRVVFTATDQSNPDVPGLYSRVIDGSDNPIQLGPPNVSLAGISPDSRRIVYTLPGAKEYTADYYSLPIDGSDSPIKLNAAFGDARVVDLTLTPDSQFALFRVDSDNDWHYEGLFAVPLAGGAPLRLNDLLPQYTEVLGYQITPDGSTVIYETGWSGPYEQWKQTVPGIYAAPIPEPAGLGLTALMSIGLLTRRRAHI